jgi:phosphonate transport system substrate-binding protein
MYDLSAFKASSNYQLRPVADLALFQALTKAMGSSQDGGDFTVVLQQLTKRAARLDTLLNSTRIETP